MTIKEAIEFMRGDRFRVENLSKTPYRVIDLDGDDTDCFWSALDVIRYAEDHKNMGGR